MNEDELNELKLKMSIEVPNQPTVIKEQLAIDNDPSFDIYFDIFNGERKNFTRSLLAKWEILKSNPIKNKSEFMKNLDKLNELNDLQDLRQKTIQKKKVLYPKTSLVRQVLAKDERVVLDKVTPKLSGLKKLLLKMKISIIV